MQQSEAEQREQIRAQLVALGLTVDEELLTPLLASHVGLLRGVRHIASLDLGEREPDITVQMPRPEAGA
jgi:hypothetical protein